MFSLEMITAWVIGLVAAFLAHSIDKKSINTYFNRIHTGADVQWAISLRDNTPSTGRHARTIAR
jgi:hypothetical protein